jgi:glyoxylase-like metal-dependent hydrolase (beta-lactamase superfamily II)
MRVFANCSIGIKGGKSIKPKPRRISMLKRISSSVHWWAEIHGEARNQPYTWNSYLIHVKKENVLVLVDPLPLSADEVREVEELGKPTHILLTCNYHLRESEVFRQKWGCKILVHQEEVQDVEVSIDGTFQDQDRLWNVIEVIRVPDVHFPEEVAFLVKEDGGVMIVGDVVCGGRKDMGIADGEISIPIPFAKYIADIQKARISLQRLLGYPFEKMCFAHGSPVSHRPKDVLKGFIENDAVWESLQKRKIEESG